MGQTREVKKHLNNLIKILKEEKQALIQGDGDKVIEIIESKNQYLEILSQFKGLNLEEDKTIMDLIEEIDSLQELNLLLTKQAQSYQNALLESLTEGLKNASSTYSEKGSYEGRKNSGLIDHSV